MNTDDALNDDLIQSFRREANALQERLKTVAAERVELYHKTRSLREAWYHKHTIGIWDWKYCPVHRDDTKSFGADCECLDCTPDYAHGALCHYFNHPDELPDPPTITGKGGFIKGPPADCLLCQLAVEWKY